jgi:hypothetical protein
MTWPWHADTPLERARRVVQMYRHALHDAAPAAAREADDRMERLGQTWAVPVVMHYDDDDLLTAALAADLMHVTVRTVYTWRRHGLTVTATPDGPRYRAGDLAAFDTARRRNRR